MDRERPLASFVPLTCGARVRRRGAAVAHCDWSSLRSRGVNLVEGKIEGFRFSTPLRPLKLVKHAEFHHRFSRSWPSQARFDNSLIAAAGRLP